MGRGGPPNSAGYREYDAALMDGASLKFGAVTALIEGRMQKNIQILDVFPSADCFNYK